MYPEGPLFMLQSPVPIRSHLSLRCGNRYLHLRGDGSLRGRTHLASGITALCRSVVILYRGSVIALAGWCESRYKAPKQRASATSLPAKLGRNICKTPGKDSIGYPLADETPSEV